MKLGKDFLSDDFSIKGSDVRGFEDAVWEVDGATRVIREPLKNISLLTPLPEEEQTDDDRYLLYLFSPEEPQKKGRFLKFAVSKAKFTSANRSNQLMLEAVENGQFLFYIGGRYIFVSKWIYKTLAQKLGVKHKAIEENSPERDIYIAKMFNCDEEVSLVCRTYDGAAKVFAILGPKYNPNKLGTIRDVYNVLEEEYTMECAGWSLDHEKAEIVFKFPEIGEKLQNDYALRDKWTPCVELSTSNIGQGAFAARGCWLVDDKYFVYDENSYVKENRGDRNPKPEELAKEIKKNVIETFGTLYKKLEELSSYIIKPAKTDGEKPMDRQSAQEAKTVEGRRAWTYASNSTAVYKAFELVYRQAEVKGGIGTERVKELRLYTSAHIDPAKVYTEYDVVKTAMTCMNGFRDSVSTSKRCAFSNDTFKKYHEAVKNMPYVDFSKSEAFETIPIADEG